MGNRRLLLATSALATAISCGRDKKPIVYAKGSHYDDAGIAADAAPADAGAASLRRSTPRSTCPANPKGTFCDPGLATAEPADAAVVDAAAKNKK